MPEDRASALPMPHDENELSRVWREEGLRYVAAMNEYLKRATEGDWDNAGEEPEDTRGRLAVAVIDVVRRANRTSALDGLRNRFPPAHSPLIDLLEQNGQSLPLVLLLDDGRIILRIGSKVRNSRVVMIDDTQVTAFPDDVVTVGRSPDRRYFAIARTAGISVHDGWDGPVVSEFPWPTGREDVPDGFMPAGFEVTFAVSRLIPFPGGDRLLLVDPEGVFVLDRRGATRLLPTKEALREAVEWWRANRPDQPMGVAHLDMEHGAVSPDGRWIAAGHQASVHHVYEARTLQSAGEIGNRSEYPHLAIFSGDSGILALNSCHFYWGVTIGVPTNLLRGIKTEPYKEDPRISVLQDGARAYAGVFRDDEFIVGDASGTLIAFDTLGKRRWAHFLGSTIGDIDVSRDGKRLVATSFAGFVSIIDLDTGERDPFTIGTGMHTERRRWLFWTNEPEPLIW